MQASTYIQWKGTDVCMDLTCSCGHLSHFHGRFAYCVQCPSCKLIYELGSSVEAKMVDKPVSEPLQDHLSYD